jgi:glutamate racemase
LLVPLIEEGWLTHRVTRLTAEEYLAPLFKHDIDTLVLGCTHYPLLKPLLQDIVGGEVTLVDSAATVTDQAQALLAERGLANPSAAAGDYRVYVTDVPQRFQQVGERFLGRVLDHVHVVTW